MLCWCLIILGKQSVKFSEIDIFNKDLPHVQAQLGDRGRKAAFQTQSRYINSCQCLQHQIFSSFLLFFFLLYLSNLFHFNGHLVQIVSLMLNKNAIKPF